MPPIFSRPGVPGHRRRPAQGLEDRVEPFHGRIVAADHHAVASFESPDAAAGAHVHVMDLFGGKVLRPANVVDVIRVAAVDEDVASFEQRREIGNASVHGRGRHHQPNRPRFLQLRHEIRERRRTNRLLLNQTGDGLRRAVVDDALVPLLHEPADHVGAHAAQADHSELHRKLQVEEGRNPPSRQRQNELKEYIPVHRCIGEHDGAAA